ncbi:MAG TPA: GNAT family N-acetyltransferase [Gemmatimonadales bacterium]|nr:GNAT family N-acetyltransferase [Gemmatimonadales bacterium]
MAATPRIEVVPYAPAYRAAFAALNREWIERHFVMEPADHAVLDDPEGAILAPGGAIFFVLEDGVPLGTCALIVHAPGVLELAKMAVAPAARGRGYAKLLMAAALAHARASGAQTVELVSSRSLAPALALYRQYGFVEVPLGPAEEYARADIKMALALR